jgi:NADH-quinone oxidoreductase subunit A
MPPIGHARSRFNVKFYVVAMMFLLFDVEIVFLWPWALVFYDVAVNGEPLATAAGEADKAFLFGGIAVFFLILVVGYIYDWGKGVFRWN